LGYDDLGDWNDRPGFEGKGNQSTEPEYLRARLGRRGVDAGHPIRSGQELSVSAAFDSGAEPVNLVPSLAQKTKRPSRKTG
jgi:hypothetical protein